jgi:hypothetical protein
MYKLWINMERKSEATLRPIRKNDKKMHSKRTAGPPLLAGKALPQSQLLTWLAKASAHYHSDEADPKAPGIVRYRPVAFNSVLQFSSGKGKSNSTNSNKYVYKSLVL